MVHPASARVVLGILRDGDDDRDLTKVVMADPALSAAVLRAANSAHLGYSGRIGGIRQAAVMLGGSLVGSLAASRVADLVFDTRPREYPDWFWLHSVAVACGASVIARHLGESVDEAYSAGILHDIGHLLGASNAPDAEPGLSLTSPEERAESGARLLKRWNMPDRIVAAAASSAGRVNATSPTIVRAVRAAHAVAEALGATSPDRSIGLAEALELTGLRTVRQSALVAEVESEITAVTSELTVGR